MLNKGREWRMYNYENAKSYSREFIQTNSKKLSNLERSMRKKEQR